MNPNEALSNALGIEHEILPAQASEATFIPKNALTVTHEFDSQGNLVPYKEQIEEESDPNADDRKEDYSLSRDVFRDLIKKGNDAIDGIAEIAKISESPRAYEVMSTLIKTVSDTTKELLILQKNFKDLQGGGSEKKRIDESVVNVDKAVFCGTTAELLKQIKMKKIEESK